MTCLLLLLLLNLLPCMNKSFNNAPWEPQISFFFGKKKKKTRRAQMKDSMHLMEH
jgi:hypothetical protein